jgi:hypothetical protein
LFQVALWAEFERKQKIFDPTAVALMKMLPAAGAGGDGKTHSPPQTKLTLLQNNASFVKKDAQPAATPAGKVNGGAENGLSSSAGRQSLRLKTKRPHVMDDYEYPLKRPRRMDA